MLIDLFYILLLLSFLLKNGALIVHQQATEQKKEKQIHVHLGRKEWRIFV